MKLSRLFCLSLFGLSFAQGVSQNTANRVRPLITQPVSDDRKILLRGNVHPLALRSADHGQIQDSEALGRMLMTLRRTEEQETALRQLLDEQQDKSSANFHKWLTPQEFGERFGAADSDLKADDMADKSRIYERFSYQGRTVVEFSGSAGAVRQTFGASMHRFSYQGKQRTANVEDPRIPEALSALVSGFDSLNNFPRRTYSQTYGVYRRDPATGKVTPSPAAVSPNFVYTDTSGNRNLGLTPYDFATLYNVKPLWDSGIDGTGQSIAIVGESDLDPKNFVNFRKLFGLPLGSTSGPTGTQYLNIIHNGPNPGFQADEVEGNLDTQWSGAIAKGATINYVSSLGTETTAGIDLSALYIVNNNLASVISESWGICERYAGAGGNAFYKALWQQAAAQGMSVLVSSGDSGSAGCDQGDPYATTGLAVNAIASTPHNTAVGGTDFQTFFGDSGKFGSGNNSTTKASLTGYIAETTWNNTCTNEQLGLTSIFPGQTPEQICNNSLALSRYGLVSTVGGSGGRSNCTSLLSDGVTCSGAYAQPSWQSGAGVSSDTVRRIPDVSLFASNGFSGAFYMICQDDALAAGKTCNVDAPYSDILGIGGTSASAPAMAGILALVNQKTGVRLGNANYNLYGLFNRQVTAGTSCNSTAGPGSACTFNDVTAGTISTPCQTGTRDCITATAGRTYGILSGYSSAVGYDLATGLGSVNAANLANNWSSVTYASTATILSLSPTTIRHGAGVTANVSVSSSSGTPTGDVTLNGATTNGSVGGGTLTGGSFSSSFNSFPGGSYQVKAHYGGDGSHAQSDSNAVTLTVTPEDSKTLINSYAYDLNTGRLSVATTSFYGQYLNLVKFSVVGSTCATTPCNGVPTGTVSIRNNGAAYGSSSLSLNSEGVGELQTVDFTPGSYSFSGTYSGDASFNTSSSGTSSFAISKAPTTTQFVSPPTSAAAGSTVTFQLRVPSSSYGNILQTGTVVLSTGSTVLATVSVTGTYDTSTGLNYATATASVVAPATGGTYPIVATYSGDSNYLGSSVTVNLIVTGSVTTPSFTLSANPTSVTVKQGASGTASITVSPQTGFTGTVNLNCVVSGSPTGAGCSFSPSSVATSGSATLTVTTTAPRAVTASWKGQAITPGLAAVCAVLFFLPIKRVRRKGLLAFLAAFLILGAATGCGKGGSSTTTSGGTPVGSYTVTVTGTSGSLSATTSVTLTIN